MNMSNEQRLTAEEFRDAVMDEYLTGDLDTSAFCVSIFSLCDIEADHRSELAAMDFNDCEGGACKL